MVAAIELLESGPRVREPDAVGRVLGKARTVVAHRELHAPVAQSGGDGDPPRRDPSSDAVANGVFDERLEDQARNT
jgi:hypothetical protein